jgi:hypothetical protein
MDQKPIRPKLYIRESASVAGVVFELGFIIALPIVIFGTLGKQLDARYGTNFFVLLGILLAITATSLWVWKRFKAMLSRLDNVVKKNLKKDQE